MSSNFRVAILKSLIILYLILFNSCAPIVKIENQSPIINRNGFPADFCIFGKYELIPSDAIIIGQIFSEGGFFTKMEYKVDESLELLREKAIEMGGNSLQIVEIHTPTPFGSKSYDIKANVLRLSSNPSRGFILLKSNSFSKTEGSIISISRKNKVYGSGNSYPLYLNREFVCSLDAGDKIIIKLLNKLSTALIELELQNNLYPVTVQMNPNKSIDLDVKIGSHGIPKYYSP